MTFKPTDQDSITVLNALQNKRDDLIYSLEFFERVAENGYAVFDKKTTPKQTVASQYRVELAQINAAIARMIGH